MSMAALQSRSREFTSTSTSPDWTTTAVPEHETTSDHRPHRKLGGANRLDRLNLLGSLCGGVCIATLLFGRIAPFSGPLGFVVVSYLCFLAIYTVLASLVYEGPAVRDKLVTVVLHSIAVALFGPLLIVILFVLIKGWPALHHQNFYTQDMSRAGPLSPLSDGGIRHGLIGTLEMITIASVLTIPIGLAAAIYMNEVGGRLAVIVRTIVDTMTALPSIVAGLFIYASWILTLHFEKSALAAALALGIMMLPIHIRASDVVLRLVPGNLREASAALGAPRWRAVRDVVLPTARSGLTTAVILSMARVLGETAPVLLTAGFTAAANTNPIHGPMVSLPLVAFIFISSPQKNTVARGYGAAAFLLLVILGLFAIMRVVGGRPPGQVSARGARRLARGSRRDLARMDRLRALGNAA